MKKKCNICGKQNIDKGACDSGFVSGTWQRPYLSHNKRFIICLECAHELIVKLHDANKGWEYYGNPEKEE
jgi:hypothetical protein